MMKKIALLSALAFSALVGTNAHAVAMTPKTVQYSCQGNKSLNITYHFNEQGLPTKAVARLAGRNRTLPINLDHSDIAGTRFGGERNFTISTEYMDTTNYNQIIVGPIMNPRNQILYKNCKPL